MKNNHSGNSLIEIIIALAIFTWLAASITSLILGTFSLMSNSGNYTKAELLAAEGIEAVRAIRSRSWKELDKTRCAVQLVGNEWTLAEEGSSEQINDFSRIINIGNVYRDSMDNIVASSNPQAILDKNTKKIISEVSWTSARNNIVSVELMSYLANWNSVDWIQDDWSGGEGQEIWTEANKFHLHDSNIDFSSTSRISLAEIATSTFADTGFIESSAYFLGRTAHANSISWSGDIGESCLGCAVQVRIKSAADDNGTPLAWSDDWCGPAGEDGNEEDFFSSTTTPESIHPDNHKPWIKYKITMFGEASSTPTVKSIIVNYKK